MQSDFSASGANMPGVTPRVDHLGVIGRHRWLVILVVGWSIVLAAAYSYTRPTIYTAEAAILVRPAVTSIDSTQGDVNPETESQVVHSTTVARLAAAQMEEHPSIATMLANLEVDVPENTEILRVLYSARDAILAARGADAFATAYLEFRQQEAEGRAAERVATLQRELDDTLIPQIEETRTELQDPDVSDTEESAARNRLRDLTAQRRIVENQLLLAQNVIIDPGEIIASPLVPRSPSSPNHTLDLALGAIIGLGLGFGMAYVRDRGDSGFKSAAALEDSLGVPVLAVIPSYRDEPSPRRDPVSLYRSNGPISEAYRALRTAVLARARDHALSRSP